METRPSAQDLHGARAMNRNRSLLGNCDFALFSMVFEGFRETVPFLETVPSEQQVPVLKTQGISMFSHVSRGPPRRAWRTQGIQ